MWDSINILKNPNHRGIVYIIDDDDFFLKGLGLILASHGFEVITDRDGIDIDEKLTVHSPDLLILDVNMPTNGFDICRNIRTHEKWSDLPILFLTSYTDTEYRLKAFYAKADDYITKPIVEKELIARIELRLENARRSSEFRLRNEQLTAVLNRLNVGTLIVDKSYYIRFVSGSFLSMFSFAEGQIMNRCLWDLGILPASSIHTGNARHCCEKNFRKIYFDLQIHDYPGSKYDRILFFYDVTTLVELNEKLTVADKRIIGRSLAVKQLLSHVREVAPTDCPVVLEGETGVGKELVARSIHESSNRRKRPFIAVNCAGLSESLISSQLFGHRKGSFTGAIGDQKGVFEEADNGTLFLDEVGDIPMPIQAGLLRVLQEQEIVRVGENKPRKIDVRIIAASNKSLTDLVQKGEFRSDLFYRICVAHVYIPALRNRNEDIPYLVQHFLHNNTLAVERHILEVQPAAMDLLVNYSWPGNIRQLKNVLDHAVIMCKQKKIEKHHLPLNLMQMSESASAEHNNSDKSKILEALEKSNGNRSLAAKMLGMGRATLYRRLKSYQIS